MRERRRPELTRMNFVEQPLGNKVYKKKLKPIPAAARKRLGAISTSMDRHPRYRRNALNRVDDLASSAGCGAPACFAHDADSWIVTDAPGYTDATTHLSADLISSEYVFVFHRP